MSISRAATWRAVSRITRRLVGILLVGGTAAAQSPVDLSGYLEHQYAVDRVAKQWTHLDYDRLRIDLKAEAGRRTAASAGLVWQLFRGNTVLDLRDYLPPALAATADSLPLELTNRTYLNHAYLTLRPGKLEVTVGKQYMTWGAAWVFNPTELFRPKNVFEPTYDREGVGALTARLPLSALSDVLFALVPERGLEESGALVRARHHLGGFDVSGMAATLHEPDSADDPALQRRITLGGDVSGELLGLGVWLEAAWSDRGEHTWLEASFGGNYTLENGTLLLIEVLHNGRGTVGDAYTRDQWMDRYAGVQRSLGRWIGYAMVSRDFGQLLHLGVSAVANPVDASAVVIPVVSYAFAQDVDILFNGLLFVGDPNSEFGTDRIGGFLRARVYF